MLNAMKLEGVTGCGGIIAKLVTPYASDPIESAPRASPSCHCASHRTARRRAVRGGGLPVMWRKWRLVERLGSVPRLSTSTSTRCKPVRVAAFKRTKSVDAPHCSAAFFLSRSAQSFPLRIFKIGVSAGLNLRWDHYRYVADQWQWGPSQARLVLRENFETVPPVVMSPVSVVERRGCDVLPIGSDD